MGGGGGGRSLCGTAIVLCTSTQHTHVVQATESLGACPPPESLDLLRLLLMQSETKFPAII